MHFDKTNGKIISYLFGHYLYKPGLDALLPYQGRVGMD